MVDERVNCWEGQTWICADAGEGACMEESCFARVSLCDRLFGRVRPLSSQDRAHAAQGLLFGRREQGDLRLGHRRDLRRESGLRRRDFLCNELKKKVERRGDLFLGGRTHLTVCRWSSAVKDGCRQR